MSLCRRRRRHPPRRRPPAPIDVLVCTSPSPPRVQVHVVEGLIWRWAGQHGVGTLFRGIRSWSKDGSSERFLHLLNQLGPVLLGLRWPIPTVFIESDPHLAHISSTLIRERCREVASEEAATRALAGLVPAGTEGEVWRLYHAGDARR